MNERSCRRRGAPNPIWPRFLRCWILSATVLAASPATGAVLFSATASSPSGRPLWDLYPGDLVTIDIRISSTGSPAVLGIGAAIFGYDSGSVDFISGSAVSSVLHDTCFAAPIDLCVDGIDNQVAGALSESAYAGGAYVQIFNGVSLTARTGTGAQDPGLDGVIGGGDAQFRVTFAVSGPLPTTFLIGTNTADWILGHAVFYPATLIADASNASISINGIGPVVPEPGAGLLLGLGFAALAGTGRERG